MRKTKVPKGIEKIDYLELWRQITTNHFTVIALRKDGSVESIFPGTPTEYSVSGDCTMIYFERSQCPNISKDEIKEEIEFAFKGAFTQIRKPLI
jgi:hypothetical protein